MTLKVTLSNQTESLLKERAAAVGEQLEAFASHMLEEAIRRSAASENPTYQSVQDSGESGQSADVREFDRALDELFVGDTRLLPETQLSYSRDDIYFDHD